MTFEVASAPETKPAGTGFSMSLQFSKTQETVRITITEAAQKEHFGGPIAGKRAQFLIGREGDRGRVKILIVDDGDFEVKQSAGKSVFIKVNRWNLLPKDKRPTQPLGVIGADASGVVLMVPDYSRVASVPNGGGKPSQTGREINLGGGKSVHVPKAEAMA